MKRTKKNATKAYLLDRLKALSGKDIFLTYVFHVRALKKTELYNVVNCVEAIMSINMVDRGTCWAWVRDIYKNIEVNGVNKIGDNDD